MGSVAKLNEMSHTQSLTVNDTPDLQVSRLPKVKRTLSEARLTFLNVAIEKHEQLGISRSKSVEWLLATARTQQLPEFAQDALDTIGKMPGRSTLLRWWQAIEDAGSYAEKLLALADSRKGRQRKSEGWEVRATHLFNSPTKPHMSTVAIWLQQEGWEVTPQKVRRYLKSLPAELGEFGVKRMGRHYYNQNIKPHIMRDVSKVPVGLIYQGDGHRCDVYVQHPNSGKHYRPELTVWIDLRSQYIPGWWLAEDESAVTTLYSLTAAMASHDHTPAMIHVDPGSGFKNKLIDDEVTGFLQRFAIESMHALPGNAKGKGLVEGLFHWFEERLGKTFEAYCGHCRTDDALSRLEFKIRKGEIRIPSYTEYREAVAKWVDWHNNTPKKALGGKSPAELWDSLNRVPLHCEPQDLVWPQAKRTVRRGWVNLFNRVYGHDTLPSFNGKQVVVQYNLQDDNLVVIRDEDQRFICEATLVNKKDAIAASRLEDLQEKRLKAQIKRHEKHIEEAERRARPTLEHTDTLAAIEDLGAVEFLEAEKNADSLPEIDVFDVGYLDQE
ncbi:Mu transposase C-terminal domain-containing protein [Vibrio injensis]|uniref:Mu transposase C-terminal domain-containing protein n=1 Tax=Vibrio injensis TaxID=1307414 RepID=UPI0009341211|nr:Mu transposase C-terminal domain-containing protein [Vibrio injensis]